MSRSFKTFLLWLLMAVLPLHAVAATLSTSCGPIHHKAMQIAAQAEVHHHHDGVAAHSHGGSEDAAGSTSEASVADDASSKPSHDQHHSNCSACAATCIGACAPPSSLQLTPALSGSEIVVISSAPLATGIIPGGLERPPRHHFA